MKRFWQFGVGSALVLFSCGTAPAQSTPAPASADVVGAVQTPVGVERTRPEQQLTEHDRSDKFQAGNAPVAAGPIQDQPEQGAIRGFDFYRDPLNSAKPMMTFEEIMEADVKAKAGVMQAHRQLLETRYDLAPKPDPDSTMSRGKPRPMGPTARSPGGATGTTSAG